MAGGFSFGNSGNTSAPATSAPAFSFGSAASTTGAPATTSSTTGFSLAALSSATNPPASSATAAPVLGFGGAATTSAATTTSTGFGGFSGFGSSAAASKPTLTGLLGATTTAAAPTTVSNQLVGGLSLGGLGGLAASKAPTSSAGGLTLGGLGGTAAPATTTSVASKGLGGVDPATSTKNDSSKPGAGDGKSGKEENMPNELVDTVHQFKEFVKTQKGIREKIMMVSSQPMYKVQEQTASLKHLLSTVALGLQRNVAAIDKLKQQTSQELHNVELAHRTRETPAGLQYENTAPTEYFNTLLENFDSRMSLYRKLIEDTEGYILGAQQGAAISPQDLFALLKRLHETFIALAAQLQGIHELVKEQKESYLTYRRVFHHDDGDAFAKRKQVAEKAKLTRTKEPLGPTPFSLMSTYAATMMAMAMNRQQPAQQIATNTGFPQPQTTSLFGNAATSTASTGFGGFGAAATKPSGFSGFGSTLTSTAPSTGLFGTKPTGFGFGSAAATTKPTLGFGTATTSQSTGFGFGSAPAATTTAFGFGSTSSGGLFGQAAVKPLGVATPQNLAASAPGFSLQAPPSKRK